MSVTFRHMDEMPVRPMHSDIPAKLALGL